jgi:hypothetical protein
MKKPDNVSFEMQRKGLTKILAPGVKRMHLSTGQSFAYAEDVLKAGQGKVLDPTISKSIPGGQLYIFAIVSCSYKGCEKYP